MENNTITIQTRVNKPLAEVWQKWTQPEHIIHWNHASDDWHSPSATNDLRPQGRFSYRMEAKDGSFGFDYCGTYDEIIEGQKLSFTLDDSRKVEVEFIEEGGGVLVRETFATENVHNLEQQRTGWQAILDNFKRYVENS